MEPNQTQYDLRFRLFGIDVRVHPMFWLIAALLGWPIVQDPETGIPYLFLWIGCVFMSILVHELGHIFMGMVFGTHGHIVLYSFGGLAIPNSHIYTWWKRVLVSVAGPLAGFLLLAAVLIGLLFASPGHFFGILNYIVGLFGLPGPFSLDMIRGFPMRQLPQVVWSALSYLIFLNLFWGLLNLLPVWPLDGGHICRDVLTRFSRDRGLRLSLGISFLVAGLLAINSLLATYGRGIPYIPGGGFWMAIIFALLAIQSFQLLQQRSSFDPYDPWHGQGRPWERHR